MKKFLKAAAAVCAASVFNACAFAAEVYVRPCGETVGMKLYTDGLLVVGTTDGSPAEKSGLRPGDIITSAGGKTLDRADDLTAAADASDGALTLTVRRGENTRELEAEPEATDEGRRLGVWVRDSTAGIGTVTYITEDGERFAALGHGITDVDTGGLLAVKSGSVVGVSSVSVRKSSRGDIGELSCPFDGETLGAVEKNSPYGVYGSVCADAANGELPPLMRAAGSEEITEGAAQILCDIDGTGARGYDIEIKKVSHAGAADKSLVIEITDGELIEKTGGILQGMSGSPIVRGDLFLGAVTHVFINNPLRGFGITGEAMIYNY